MTFTLVSVRSLLGLDVAGVTFRHDRWQKHGCKNPERKLTRVEIVKRNDGDWMYYRWTPEGPFRFHGTAFAMTGGDMVDCGYGGICGGDLRIEIDSEFAQRHGLEAAA